MGYETELRRKDRSEISSQDWKELLEAHPQLEADPKQMAKAHLESEDGLSVEFLWSPERITVYKASEAATDILCSMADQLCNCVVRHELDEPGEPTYESGDYVPPAPKKTKKKARSKKPRPYSPKEGFAKGDTIEHPKFGAGVVTEVRGKKITVDFDEGSKVLVHTP